MAITSTYINNDMTVLTTFLQQMVPEYFASVAYSEASNAITIKDADDNIIFVIRYLSYPIGYELTAYCKNGGSFTSTCATSTSAKVGNIQRAYLCNNGALIGITHGGGAAYGAILIAKTNNNETAFVFTYATSGNWGNLTSFSKSACAVAFSDDEPIPSFSFYSNNRSQTLLVPFFTNPEIGKVSWTPNAGFLEAGQYYSMGYGTLTLDGVNYLTNGYWAIKDE